MSAYESSMAIASSVAQKRLFSERPRRKANSLLTNRSLKARLMLRKWAAWVRIARIISSGSDASETILVFQLYVDNFKMAELVVV